MEQPDESRTASAGVDWTLLVDGIRASDPGAMEELYAFFEKGIRYFLQRQLGPQELEDKIHDNFIIVVQAIRRGELREPERLMGFVRTIAQRHVAAHINEAVHVRRDKIQVDESTPLRDTSMTPEDSALNKEKLDLMVKTLRSMPSRDRELLTRFYLQEQTQEQICSEMRLTESQFRLMKSRAKARFGEKGRRLSAVHILARTFSGFRH